MTDVFISYASQDRDRIQPLYDRLVGAGLEVWWDQRIEMGTEYPRAIEEALDQTKCVLVVWSRNSVQSEWVEIEATEALDRHILEPVMIDNVRPPIRFRRIQSTRLIAWPDADYEAELGRLLMSVRAMVARGAERRASRAAISPLTSEKRDVTVMYVHLTNRLFPGRSEAIDRSRVRDSALRRVSHVVEEFGGVVTQHLVDRFEGVFGLSTAYEDDSLRAVRAAFELRAEVDQFNAEAERDSGKMDLRVGIERSTVIVGGADAEDTQPILTGHCVDIASHLVDHAAPRDILVGDRICGEIAPYFETEHHCRLGEDTDGVELSGHRVVGGIGAETRFDVAQLRGLSPFIGRADELALLRLCERRAYEGRGRAVAVVGEAGIGKSRLVHEFRSGTDRDRTLVCAGRCRAYGVRPAYGPFVDVLRALLDIRDTEAHDLHDRVVARVLAIDPRLEAHLPHFLHLLAIESTAHPMPNLERERLRFEIQEALLAIISLAGAERLCMIFLEDWQWADESSIEMLDYLVQAIEDDRVMVVVLQRPEADRALEWDSYPHAQTVTLTPLPESEGLALLRAMLPDVPEELVAPVVERAGGNPFYLEEICYRLRETHRLAVDALDEIPQAVRALIGARIFQLDDVTRGFLMAASVVGRGWSRRLIERVSGRDPQEIAHILTVLMQRGFVQQTRMVPEPRYMLKHDITREVALDMLPAEELARLHENVGEALEQLYADGLGAQLETLAYHFTRSDNLPKAVSYSVRAAAQALERSATANAMGHATAALELLQRMPETEANSRLALEASQTLASAQVLATGYASGDLLAVLTRALALSEQLDDVGAQFASLCALWRYHYNAGAIESARGFGLRMRELAALTDNGGWRVAAEAALGQLYGIEGELEASVKCFDAAEAAAPGTDEAELAPHFGGIPSIVALTLKGLAYNAMGRFAEAREVFERARDRSEASGDTPTKAYAWYYSSIGLFNVGHLDESLALADELIAMSEHEGFLHWLALARFLRMAVSMATGQVTPYDQMEAAAQAVFERGVHVSEAMTCISLAVGAWLNGNQSAAEAHLATARAAVEEDGIGYFASDINRYEALICQANEPERARELLEAAVWAGEAQGGLFWALKAAVDWTRLDLARGDARDALAQLDRIVGAFKEGFDLPDLQAAASLLEDQHT